MNKAIILIPILLVLTSVDTNAQSISSVSTANAITAHDQAAVKGTGTTNHLAKWTDRRTLSDSTLTEVRGNVGIGTPTPNTKLTIEGAASPGSENEAGVLLSVVNSGEQGSGLLVRGSGESFGAEGIISLGGNGKQFPGEGILSGGGSGPFGGNGVNTTGGVGTAGTGGTGVVTKGGESVIGDGGPGIMAIGGFPFSANNRSGDGIIAAPGPLRFGGSPGRAGVFRGDVEVTGTLTKAGGSFKIDHPLDPAHRYLSHSFVESPDMMNVYNGNTITDQSGNAIVELPAWFEALNRDFRYQLTVIGTFAQAIVGQKIARNRFIVKTSAPNVEVSWQVTGIRRDPWANDHRIEVEQEKADADRGRYLYPEGYGATAEMSIEQSRATEPVHQAEVERAKLSKIRK